MPNMVLGHIVLYEFAQKRKTRRNDVANVSAHTLGYISVCLSVCLSIYIYFFCLCIIYLYTYTYTHTYIYI